MDDRRLKGSSCDKFSFPDVSIQSHQEFEFDFGSTSATPRSPNSPADHLFSNGKLLPHSFVPGQLPRNSTGFLRSMSRTSSISSKDSSFLMSSRTNSTNSSSSCSSARTSVSIESSPCSSERKVLSQGKDGTKVTVKRERKQRDKKPVLSSSQQQYGSSQRWQFIAVPVPPSLSRQSSRIKKGETVKKKRVVEDKSSKKSKGFCRRFFASFMSTCRECHAMNPSRTEHVLDEGFDNFQ